MFPIVNIGPLAIQADGLIILIGIYIWFSLNDRNAKIFGIDSDKLSNLMFISMIIGIIGARLGVILQNPQVFIENPLSIISLNLNLFDLPSGILFAILSFLVLVQRKKFPLLHVLDVNSAGFLIFLAFISLAFLANGNLYGLPSDLPWSINLWGTLRHPLQVYYVILFVLAALIILNQQKHTFPVGTHFWLMSIFVSLIIIFLEPFRGTTNLIINQIRIPQLIGIIILLIGLSQLHKYYKTNGISVKHEQT